jgi:hypothetical protein
MRGFNFKKYLDELYIGGCVLFSTGIGIHVIQTHPFIKYENIILKTGVVGAFGYLGFLYGVLPPIAICVVYQTYKYHKRKD